jgi:alkylated DNA repair dioxygenase AlkB
MYYNEDDNITYHSDDPFSLDPTAPIFVFSFGSMREFSVQPLDSNAEYALPVQSGSLLVWSVVDNNTTKHAVLPSNRQTGARASIIFRKIVYYRQRDWIVSYVKNKFGI